MQMKFSLIVITILNMPLSWSTNLFILRKIKVLLWKYATTGESMNLSVVKKYIMQ